MNPLWCSVLWTHALHRSIFSLMVVYLFMFSSVSWSWHESNLHQWRRLAWHGCLCWFMGVILSVGGPVLLFLILYSQRKTLLLEVCNLHDFPAMSFFALIHTFICLFCDTASWIHILSFSCTSLATLRRQKKHKNSSGPSTWIMCIYHRYSMECKRHSSTFSWQHWCCELGIHQPIIFCWQS